MCGGDSLDHPVECSSKQRFFGLEVAVGNPDTQLSFGGDLSGIDVFGVLICVEAFDRVEQVGHDGLRVSSGTKL